MQYICNKVVFLNIPEKEHASPCTQAIVQKKNKIHLELLRLWQRAGFQVPHPHMSSCGFKESMDDWILLSPSSLEEEESLVVSRVFSFTGLAGERPIL